MSSPSDWGSQLGVLALDIGSGAASYELAKRDPKGFLTMQKWIVGFFLAFFAAIVVIFIVAAVN